MRISVSCSVQSPRRYSLPAFSVCVRANAQTGYGGPNQSRELLAGVVRTPPFGFLNDKEEPVGFISISSAKSPNISAFGRIRKVTSPTRIPLLIGGNVDTRRRR